MNKLIKILLNITLNVILILLKKKKKKNYRFLTSILKKWIFLILYQYLINITL